LNERHKQLLKLERDNKKEITAAILYLLLKRSPSTRLQLMAAVPSLTKTIRKAVEELQQRSRRQATADSLEEGEEPVEDPPTKARETLVAKAARGIAIALVTYTALRTDEEPFQQALDGALDDIDPRVRRLATTETFTAYNSQWRANLQDSPGEFVWDAILDKRTCPRCEALHGKSWPTVSAAPACPAHVSCRCILNFEPAS
jgi:SPP1 gp7 family putative phage head morphogenesis protein